MASKVAAYERLLKDISTRSNEADRMAIQNALENVSIHCSRALFTSSR